MWSKPGCQFRPPHASRPLAWAACLGSQARGIIELLVLTKTSERRACCSTSATQGCQVAPDVVPAQLCEGNRCLLSQAAARHRLTGSAVVRLRAGGFPARPSGSNAAYALAEAQPQADRDAWRAVEALLRLSASDITVGDADMSLRAYPNTYNSMVRSTPGAMQCRTQVLGATEQHAKWLWSRLVSEVMAPPGRRFCVGSSLSSRWAHREVRCQNGAGISFSFSNHCSWALTQQSCSGSLPHAVGCLKGLHFTRRWPHGMRAASIERPTASAGAERWPRVR